MNLRSLSLAASLLLVAATACGKVADGGDDDDLGDSDHRADAAPDDPGTGDGGTAGTSALEVDRGEIDFGNVVRGQMSAGARFTVHNA
ncbi:MAG TPA: hypothetical protein VIG06_09770, partial [Kofleriaceae bacterium]